jgi:hypothetical protein
LTDQFSKIHFDADVFSLTTKAPHPHGALFSLNYIHFKDGQKVEMQGGTSSPRDNMSPQETKFKKAVLEAKYSVDEFERKFAKW